ncbi:T9SS type A sorting domain-containing protein [Fluviicola sp.]|uniref:T9SS type A sorting domain-containing protein n=1 Tax=Fluviicola sp. TaxID=1917219 RepID=UPI003D2D5937
MKKKLIIITGFVGLSHFGFSQFIVKDVFFQTQGVSNTGEVVGYEEWTGPFSIWTPETQAVEYIGGIAPGNGVGGGASFSLNGNFLSGNTLANGKVEMARYSRLTNSWTPLGSLGVAMDTARSGGYWISGDGNTVVGNAWKTGGYTDAVAWNPTEGIIDLGTLFAGRSTRGNAVSNDGSVVVGWQDFNGPWKSAVWRKNPAGGYFPNEYILLNPNGNPNDEFNQMGECTAVSGDGNWVGGAGDYVNNGNAWIWSQATGVIDLGTLSPGAQSYVAALSDDGSIAVGRIQVGPWDPEIPFIWTQANGMQNLNDYAHNVLGIATGNKLIYSANCMSPSGDYIVGYGYDTVTFDSFAYRLSPLNLGLNELSSAELKVYPNPTSNLLTIENEGNASLMITNPEGKSIVQTKISGNYQLDVSNFASGIYFVSVKGEEDGNMKTTKVIKK